MHYNFHTFIEIHIKKSLTCLMLKAQNSFQHKATSNQNCIILASAVSGGVDMSTKVRANFVYII